MASTLSSWYHNQYSAWNRTRRLQAPPFLTRLNSRVTRVADHPPGGDVVIHMGDLLPSLQNDRSPQAGEKKRQDTLFGPSIGIVNPGPDWAEYKVDPGEKPPLQDVLTPELVKNWVEKSKEASQPTTTLQALVNLKRPTLRLSPISHDGSENDVPQQHGLEFQFDCDAPKCRISLHIITSPLGDYIVPAPSSSPPALINVFNAVVDGGFGRVLKLEEGATLELDKFDPAVQPRPPPSTPKPVEDVDPEPAPASEQAVPQKKRFTLRIRRRTHPHAAEDTNRVSVAGPSLQVVDVESPAEGASSTQDKDEGGVKVLIRLEALDANEHTLVSPNAQSTYLHIVRLGAAPAAGTSDTRPWVVRVVKREATIGPHTFHLHEIYGLSSHAAATAPEPNSYSTSGTAAAIDADDPTSECLLCLSSPREVVLLPCRHLVACKECAVNMVEFGAGGQLVHTDDGTTGDQAHPPATGGPAETTGESSGAAVEGEAAAAPASAPTPAPAPVRTTNPRRKRKAKGWFCPVCRQPYTSLLRISTTALGKPVGTKPAEGEGVGAETETTSQTRTSVSETRPGILHALSSAAACVTGSEPDGANDNSNGTSSTDHLNNNNGSENGSGSATRVTVAV